VSTPVAYSPGSPPTRQQVQGELNKLIARARVHARQMPPSPQGSHAATWDPMIAALLAADDGDETDTYPMPTSFD
jgi:hypothetical protein